MSRINIKQMFSIKKYKDTKFFLPNGVSIFENGNIIVADGGNDRICLFNSKGNELKEMGKKGYGKYSLTEPVGVFVSPDQKAYVTDWHNHRIVIYDNRLKYLGEFGHYGNIMPCKTDEEKRERILNFKTNLKSIGCYIQYHFLPLENKRTKNVITKKLYWKKLLYWFYLNRSIKVGFEKMYSHHDALNKPNGVAFWKDNIYITQKNYRCISLYKKSKKSIVPVLVKHYFEPKKNMEYGRLANINCDAIGNTYLCDERKSKIWCFDPELNLIKFLTGKESAEGTFLPFSCCMVGKNVLAVCGGLNFQLIDIRNNVVKHCSEDIGELHSIAYDRHSSNLYIADRSAGEIKIFNIDI